MGLRESQHLNSSKLYALQASHALSMFASTMYLSSPALRRSKILRTSLTRFVPFNTYTFQSLLPRSQLLDSYKKHGGGWNEYEKKFLQLMKERRVETAWAQELRDADCLLCSEEKPDHCHRRLVAEYLAAHHDDIRIQHLG